MRGMQLKFDEIYGKKIIPENDSVRMVEKIVSEMDLSCLYRSYSQTEDLRQQRRRPC